MGMPSSAPVGMPLAAGLAELELVIGAVVVVVAAVAAVVEVVEIGAAAVIEPERVAGLGPANEPTGRESGSRPW